MYEQYFHLLIATPASFVPTADQLAAFYTAITELGVVPESAKATLSVPTGEFREYGGIDPFTGDPAPTIRRPVYEPRQLGTVADLAFNAKDLTEYSVFCGETGSPKTPPVPIDFQEPYFVGVNSFVYPTVRSPSSCFDESIELPGYRSPCSESDTVGYFANPETGQTIEVKGAGCARFWVEVELGKFLFPVFPNNSPAILNPKILQAAESCFGVHFLQGCWLA